jgi:hypothetical protein
MAEDVPPKNWQDKEELTVSQTQRELIVALGRRSGYRATAAVLQRDIRKATGRRLMETVWQEALANEVADGRVVRLRGMHIELSDKPE